MARKVRLTGIFAVLLIIIGAAVSIFMVQANTIGDVEKVTVKNVGSNSVELSWRGISSADGYFVYGTQKGKNDYKKMLELKDASKNECVVENLKQATEYDFYVTAYKMDGEKIVESENHETFEASTVPLKQKVSLSSSNGGEMQVEWDLNKRATGYEIQYIAGKIEGTDKDFEGAEAEVIEKSDTNVKKYAKLKIDETYNVRVRSYSMYNDNKLYGEWSDIKSVKIAKKVEMVSSVDPKKPMVALTFDDGPGYNGASDRILDVLEKYNARATFFMVGVNAADHPENVKRKVKLKCEIGNHSYDHSKYGNNVNADSITKATKAIKGACGEAPTAFRSPGGMTTPTILQVCKEQNLPLYYWTLDTQDWKYRNADTVYNNVMKNVKDGDIILMHEIYDSTAEAVERIVPELIKQGYQLVTCQELVVAKTGKNPVAGQQYVDANTIKNAT